MTRINIGYLLALGLLGTAVACKYLLPLAQRSGGDKQLNTNPH
jgi:hypothetical protein